jgi:small subunit ribosomal protein S16
VAVKIRLKRMGKIRAPHYRIVVVDSRKKRDGKVIEEIGLYHPKEDPSYISVVSDRAQYWLGVGAQPSEAVHKLLRITGDWQKFKGIDGAEGSLRTAEAKRSKLDIFNEALKDSANEPKTEALKDSANEPKTEAVTRRTAKKSAAKSEDAPAAEVAETPSGAPTETPTETPAEEPAAVPAVESPEGATEQAESAETAAVEAETQQKTEG